MANEIKADGFVCFKEMGGKGPMVTCNYRRKASEIYIHPDKIILGNVICKKEGETTICDLKRNRPYRLGEKYRGDFDYCGMLDAGAVASLSDGVTKLNKLFSSFEDVNYHSESEPLSEAINALKSSNKDLAQSKIIEFNKRSRERVKEIC